MKRLFLTLVMVSFVVVGCSNNAAKLDALRQERAESVATACITYLVHHGSCPKQLADLLPDYAPKGDCFAGLTPEQTIQGYDYFGGGVPAGKTGGRIAISNEVLWLPQYPLKTSDLPTSLILRTSEPLSDGRRVIVTLGGSVVFQPAK